jgi:hypothetical protein
MPDFKRLPTVNGADVALASHTHSTLLPRGTSFPGSPAANDLFFRTDLGITCQYNGTRWLGPPEPVPFTPWEGAAPYNTSGYAPFVFPSIVKSFVFIEVDFLVYVYTTNNASNYWTISITNAITTLLSVITASIGANAVITVSPTINPATLYTSAMYLNITITKTGAPGNIDVSPNIRVRRQYT